MPRLILGADIGGTSTRLRLTRGEVRVAERNGGGCNIRSSGTDAAGRVADLLTELAGDARAAGEDLASVEAAVLGVAGAGPARHAEVSALLLPALARAGVPAGVGRVVDDQVTAFTAGAGRVGATGSCCSPAPAPPRLGSNRAGWSPGRTAWAGCWGTAAPPWTSADGCCAPPPPISTTEAPPRR